MNHVTHEEARLRRVISDHCRQEEAECNRQLAMMRREGRQYAALVAAAALAVLLILLTACDSLPAQIEQAQQGVATAQQAVDAAEQAVDDLEAQPDADPAELADAREVLAKAREALDYAEATLTKISEDESPEAGIAEAIGGALTSATGQPWFYIAGITIAGFIRERRRAAIAKANSVALAKSVQPAIDAADETVKSRVRDLQAGQPGIGEIVNAARGTN